MVACSGRSFDDRADTLNSVATLSMKGVGVAWGWGWGLVDNRQREGDKGA